MSNELTGQKATPVAGVLGTNLGMTHAGDEDGKLVPVTDAPTGAVQIAFGQIAPRKVSKPLKGHFEKAGVTPRRHLVELRTSDAADYSLGQEIDASIFAAGQKVDVVGTSKGKGTAGVLKRHGFAGVSFFF